MIDESEDGRSLGLDAEASPGGEGASAVLRCGAVHDAICSGPALEGGGVDAAAAQYG